MGFSKTNRRQGDHMVNGFLKDGFDLFFHPIDPESLIVILKLCIKNLLETMDIIKSHARYLTNCVTGHSYSCKGTVLYLILEISTMLFSVYKLRCTSTLSTCDRCFIAMTKDRLDRLFIFFFWEMSKYIFF